MSAIVFLKPMGGGQARAKAARESALRDHGMGFETRPMPESKDRKRSAVRASGGVDGGRDQLTVR